MEPTGSMMPVLITYSKGAPFYNAWTASQSCASQHRRLKQEKNPLPLVRGVSNLQHVTISGHHLVEYGIYKKAEE